MSIIGGGLLHLSLINPLSRIIRNTTSNVSQYSYESIIVNLDNINNLSGIADIILPEYLLIDMNNQTSEHNIEYIIKNYKLVFNMGEKAKSIYIPLQFFDYLEKSSITLRNKLKIPIHFNYFINSDGLPLLDLAYNNISVNIEHITNGKKLYNSIMICRGKFLDKLERLKLFQKQYQYKIRCITTLQLESTTPEKIFNINGSGPISGIIFEINNPSITIENINRIELLIDGFTRHNFIGDLIDTQCQRLALNAIYIPLNLDGDLMDEINSNVLNLSCLNNFQIKISTNLYNGFIITIYVIQPNLYKVNNGIIDIQYIFNLSFTVSEPESELESEPDSGSELNLKNIIKTPNNKNTDKNINNNCNIL